MRPLARVVSICAIFTLALQSTSPAAPFFVDLQAVANSNFGDDGLANNGKGGWTDEGINDMLIYPPIPSGVVTRNGYHFQIIDPAKNKSLSVVLLQGQVKGTNYPKSVTAKVPDIKAKYVYFLHNAAGQPPALAPDYTVAQYTIHYTDGTEAIFPLRNNNEIRQWWCSAWWDNNGAKDWPIFMGCNFYSLKWNQYVGVWATQWLNATPDKAISSITLASEGKAMPAIYAITLDDEDYSVSPDVKKDFKRPDGPPEGFFDERMAIENKAILEGMTKLGMAQGIRKTEVIRPDLLAVTLDGIVAGGPGQGEAKAKALQTPDNFTLTSSGDTAFAAGIHPTRVGRLSFNYWTGDIGTFPGNRVYWHTYYLQLPATLKSGQSYTIQVAGLPATVTTQYTLAYSDHATLTPVIKVNQASYSSKSQRRYAYLGWWAADLGAVDYSAFPKFQVLNADNNKVVLEGTITLTGLTNSASGESVCELNLAPVTASGRYHIVVPGLGRSDTFSIGREGMKDLYVKTMRGFLIQRCGAELTSKVTDYPRPPCHLKNYENGHLVENGPPLKPNEPVREFRGGYHDAGDCDVFYMHLLAGQQILTAFEFAPAAFKDGDLNIPESGNGIPDILDEVLWGLKFYADNQLPDGGIYAGRANDEDYGYKEWKQEWAKQFGNLPPFGNFPPCNASANIFAAVASHTARVLKPFDAKQSNQLQSQALKAYEWGLKHHSTDYETNGVSYGRIPWKRAWALAAAELFNTTGEARFNTDFIKIYKDGEALKFKWNEGQQQPLINWPYASCTREGVDPEIQKTARTAILKSADANVKNVDKWPYRMSTGRESGAWGNLVGGGLYGDTCLMAYLLTHDQKYLDTASLNADYQLGANPLSRSFITGVGSRSPEHPELRNWLYSTNGVPAPGIPVFGPGGTAKSMGGVYPTNVPLWRVWIDTRVDAMHNEFGITGPIGDATMLYSLLWAMETKN